MPIHLIAIAWLYVTLLMSLTERSFVAGAATFVFYGLVPLSILLWLLDTPSRRRRRAVRAAAAEAAAPAAPTPRPAALNPVAPAGPSAEGGSVADPDH